MKNLEQSPAHPPALLDYPLTEAGNAETFRDLHEGRFCYIPQAKKWFGWNGNLWVPNGEQARILMIETVRERRKAALKVPDEDQRSKIIKWCLSSESNQRLTAALSIAEAMMTVDFEEFDKDPFLLHCSNGIVDLKTGTFRLAKPEDRFRRSTKITYDPLAICPRWESFLAEIFGGDTELMEFKRRVVGYSLTGDVSEQVLFILCGNGANGKSVFLGTVEFILGDYAVTLPGSTFKERKGDDPIPNDIARTLGARFVKVIELKEGAKLNEERIKALTGGDRITARFLRKEYFDFMPMFKTWIATNHKPIIHETDDGIWRRPLLIPFEVSFPPEKRDYHLTEKLMAEAAGILNWAIQGCLEWQKSGLGIPEKVRLVSKSYREESDIVGRWVKERIIQDSESETGATEAYEDYTGWCRNNKEEHISQTAFGREMSRRGFERKEKPRIFYCGFKLQYPNHHQD